MIQSTNVDFHLSVATSGDSAVLMASWSVTTDQGKFKFVVDSEIEGKDRQNVVASAIALMSQMQETIVQDIYTWSKKIATPEVT